MEEIRIVGVVGAEEKDLGVEERDLGVEVLDFGVAGGLAFCVTLSEEGGIFMWRGGLLLLVSSCISVRGVETFALGSRAGALERYSDGKEEYSCVEMREEGRGDEKFVESCAETREEEGRGEGKIAESCAEGGREEERKRDEIFGSLEKGRFFVWLYMR